MTIAEIELRMDGAKDTHERSGLPWKWRGVVRRVREMEKEFAALSAEGILEKMDGVRRAIGAGENAEKFLESVFGAVCVVAQRQIGQRPFEVQVAGALELAHGRIAEMATGEGKTLTATMPATLLAMSGRGVHVVTVNDYLAQRDAQRMAPIYIALGLTVGVILSGMPDQERRAAYGCDVVYATNKELGFDYLRDQVKLERRRAKRERVDVLALLGWGRDDGAVMRGLYFAIVDEADSVLIDEARTPLIVAEGGGKSTMAWAYEWAEKLGQRMREGKDFTSDAAKHKVEWTPDGLARLQKILAETNTPAITGAGGGGSWQDLTLNALRVKFLYARERHYVVARGEAVIVDEFTGRRMEGRNWAEGIQQAIQAKEKLTVTAPSRTLARTTYQHFFSLYEKLSGMTGTAASDRAELAKVYALEVVAIPTHRTLRRVRLADVVVRGKREKWEAVAAEIERVRGESERPVLVGTGSIEDSLALSAVLRKRGVTHEILNALEEHAHREAEIVEAAGEVGAVTIATNMAGRGTDIPLSAAAKRAGGLHVIGTQLHESQRIDRQLAGRCGRQGDPGSVRFFLSLQDEILGHLLNRTDWLRLRRRFTGKRGEAAAARRMFAQAQRKVERLHWRQRRELMEYEEWLAKIYYQMGE